MRQTQPLQATLAGWIIRDAAVYAVFGAILWACQLWWVGAASWLAAAVAGTVSLAAAYAVCYINHEWGHWLGARMAGAELPLGGYRGVLLGLFDTRVHSRKQFQFMSVGGIAGYLATAIVFSMLYYAADGMPVTTGLCLGGAAFVAQSLSVDLPIVWRVHKGADVTTSAREGAEPRVILRRTWQSWLLLALVAAIFYAVDAWAADPSAQQDHPVVTRQHWAVMAV